MAASPDDILGAVKNIVTSINALTAAIRTVLPLVQNTSATATAGAATLPPNPVGFLDQTLPDGTVIRVPYYAE